MNLSQSWEPIGDRVLVKRLEVDQMSASGKLYVAPAGKKEMNKAEVVAVGQLEKPVVVIGDIVIFDAMRGYPIELGSVEYLILTVPEILAKIKSASH